MGELERAWYAPRLGKESVAENTVDAVVAPALWAGLGGAAGALGYRAVNTMDAMVGHRSERYRRFGTPAARLDDAANWLPARVTAPAHPSPNAGVAEAAFAAALGVRLGGRSQYEERIEDRPRLGRGRPVRRDDQAHRRGTTLRRLPAATRRQGLEGSHGAMGHVLR
ncbi:MAG TPA: cobalamin biosynthesis protein [Acidimicrobiales bacterium]|nr:cobalamin biosynthesis protein [Acidimicrobiales bacterium]